MSIANLRTDPIARPERNHAEFTSPPSKLLSRDRAVKTSGPSSKYLDEASKDLEERFKENI